MDFQYRTLKVYNLGLTSYEVAYNLQKRIFRNKLKYGENAQFLVIGRHHPVFTAGKGVKETIPFFGNRPLRYVERGGGITYHGPGQLVFYPILNLRVLGINELASFVFMMEEVARETLRRWGIVALRREGFPGLWADEFRKIFSLGIYVKKWVTMHGGALVVKEEKKKFLLDFSPCGLRNVRFTSMERILNRKISVKEVEKALVETFLDIFGLKPDRNKGYEDVKLSPVVA